MANPIKIKRRISGGASGAPAALKTAELAHNETDNIVFIGKGDDGGGNATSIIPVAGVGGFVDLPSAQTVAGVKTFSASPIVPTIAPGDNTTKAASTAFVTAAVSAGSSDPAVAIHAAASKATPIDADELGIVDTAAANVLKRLTWGNLKATLKTYFDTLYSAVAHVHTFASLTGIPTTLAGHGITDAQLSSQKGVANGYAGLDGAGKVPAAQIPASALGGHEYQGTWNASTNTPVMPAANTVNSGAFYKISVAGATTIDTINEWKVGDWIISNGTTWDKIDNTDAVSTVAGRTGAIVLTNADVSGFGTMSTQGAGAVAITGGTIDGITMDGGTF
ncbi:MAG: hypothetical protein ACEQSB_00400 [Undibacterium sp.]